MFLLAGVILELVTKASRERGGIAVWKMTAEGAFPRTEMRPFSCQNITVQNGAFEAITNVTLRLPAKRMVMIIQELSIFFSALCFPP